MSTKSKTLDSMPYHAPDNTSRTLLRDVKILADVRPGETIYIVGRWLQPFCSHATYRVRVTENQWFPKGYRRVFGVLPDFRDSPVRSLPFPETQSFRVDNAVQCEEVKESAVSAGREQ